MNPIKEKTIVPTKTPKVADIDPACVKMVKLACDDIDVHPSQIALWEAQGWTEGK